MADSRLCSLEEQVRALERNFSEWQQLSTRRQDEFSAKLEATVLKQLEDLHQLLASFEATEDGDQADQAAPPRPAAAVDFSSSPGTLPPTNTPAPTTCKLGEVGSGGGFVGDDTFVLKLPKMRLPSFDGANPRAWVFKFEQYFDLYKVPEHRKVDIAAFYLEGQAGVWFAGFESGKRVVGWKEFSDALRWRFDPKDPVDIVREWKQLQQKGDVMEYLGQFESVMLLMQEAFPVWDASFYVSSFVAGLKEELRLMVQMFKPLTLEDAYQKARLQEAYLKATVKRANEVA